MIGEVIDYMSVIEDGSPSKRLPSLDLEQGCICKKTGCVIEVKETISLHYSYFPHPGD